MRHRILTVLVILVAASAIPVAQSPPSSTALQFEVASIKRHADGDPGGGGRVSPDGSRRLINQPAAGIVAMAYPSQGGEYINLPEWAHTERYDLITKPPTNVPLAPFASRARGDQDREMMRNLLADRMKLAAHDETREEPIYQLVLARDDRKLGPNLKSRPDCIAEAQAARAARGGQPRAAPPTPPAGPPSEREIMRGCGGLFGPGRMVIGGTTMERFAAQLRGLAGRYVEDTTGLDGWYSLELRFTPAGGMPPAALAAGAPDPGDAPEIFTALQEQLGLKLEPARRQLQVVVIDHIERPTEN